MERRYYECQGGAIELLFDSFWICAGAIILPGGCIGNRAVVGVVSVVRNIVETATIVLGSPARPIKKREGFQ
jgi:acetyltransferase-like isoleucine patch superfamily enzyme